MLGYTVEEEDQDYGYEDDHEHEESEAFKESVSLHVIPAE